MTEYDQRMGDDAETGVVDSAESVEAAAATELAGVAEADTMSAFAWSEDDLDDYPGEPASLRPFLITSAAIAVSLSLVAVAGVLAYRWATDEAPAPAALSAPMTTTVAPAPKAAPPPVPPPPPVTVTTVVVQSTVPAPMPERSGPVVLPTVMPNPLPPVTPTDQLFLSRLQAQGWWVADPRLMSYRAFETCAMLHNGEPLSQVQMKLMQLQDVIIQNGVIARQFIDTAAATYPNCP